MASMHGMGSWVAALTLVASACAHHGTAPLQVPTALVTVAERYPVTGRLGLLGGTLRFGPYVAEHARVGVEQANVEKPTQFNEQTERSERHRSASFQLLSPEGARYGADCQHHARFVKKHGEGVLFDPATGKTNSDGRVVSQSETYRCTLTRPLGSPMQLFIVQGAGGLVQADSAELTFLPVTASADQPALTWKESAGFLVADGQREIAAVDLSDEPAITMRRDLTPRELDELATVCTALLMLRELL